MRWFLQKHVPASYTTPSPIIFTHHRRRSGSKLSKIGFSHVGIGPSMIIVGAIFSGHLKRTIFRAPFCISTFYNAGANACLMPMLLPIAGKATAPSSFIIICRNFTRPCVCFFPKTINGKPPIKRNRKRKTESRCFVRIIVGSCRHAPRRATTKQRLLHRGMDLLLRCLATKLTHINVS